MFISVDFVNLAFDSVGMQYDIVAVTASTSLASYLSTTGVGKYAGIVSVSKTLLSASQQQSIISYQLFICLLLHFSSSFRFVHL